MNTAEAIRLILSHPKWSQARLAKHLSIAPSSVGRYASGERIPPYDTGMKIMDTARKVRSSKLLTKEPSA